MKKIISFLFSLLVVFSVSISAFATNNTPLQYSNISALFEYWEENGYPDYVGDVFSTNGSMDNLTVLLVNDDGSIAELIRSFLIDDSGVSFGEALYSHNALKAVNDEIVANYLGSNDKIYSVGVGWTTVDGVVTGFGDSGQESRVVVSVDETIATEYANKFYKIYGDMVVVEAGGAIMLETATMNHTDNVWQLPLFISMIITVGIISLVFNRTRFIPAMQTNTGTVVTGNPPTSRKQAVAAIKSSALTPSEDVFGSIMERIDNLQK